MSLRNPAVWHLIIHKRTVMLLSHFPGLSLKRLEIASVTFVVYLVIKRQEIRMFLCNIIHDRLLKTAS